jgi:very-short-patch-repair endonuclease
MDRERKDNHSEQIARARELWKNATVGERLLWAQLRSRTTGYKFRRQHPIGPYVADFYCLQCRLVVEVDGDSHAGREERDANRTAWLEKMGNRVIRFNDWYVREHPVETAEEIQRVCRRLVGEAQ